MINIALVREVNMNFKRSERMKYKILFILLVIPVILTGCNWMYGQI